MATKPTTGRRMLLFGITVKVDAAELAHYVREKKATRREARDRAVDNV